MQAVVPSIFKKYKGKTWAEVTSSSDGIAYLQWASSKFIGPPKQLADKAIEMHQTLANFEGPDGPAKK